MRKGKGGVRDWLARAADEPRADMGAQRHCCRVLVVLVVLVKQLAGHPNPLRQTMW